MSTNALKSFKFGIIGIGLILVLIVLIQVFSPITSTLISIFVGVLTFGIGIVGIIGFIYSLKGIREPNTMKKILGIIISFTIVSLFISIMLSNVYDEVILTF